MKKKILFILSLLGIMIISLLCLFKMQNISSYYHLFFYKQIIWYILGIIIVIIISKININIIFNYSFIIYLISLILLILVLIFGNSINGSKAWFNLGYFSFQPSEVMKLSLAIFLSKITNKYRKIKTKNDLKYLLIVIIITLIPSILVFIEPDTGSIIFYLIILLINILMAKLNKKYYYLLFSLLIIMIISFLSLYLFSKDLLINLIGTSFFYRIDRFINFKKIIK